MIERGLLLNKRTHLLSAAYGGSPDSLNARVLPSALGDCYLPPSSTFRFLPQVCVVCGQERRWLVCSKPALEKPRNWSNCKMYLMHTMYIMSLVCKFWVLLFLEKICCLGCTQISGIKRASCLSLLNSWDYRRWLLYPTKAGFYFLFNQ
jgi:hypothetical protein